MGICRRTENGFPCRRERGEKSMEQSVSSGATAFQGCPPWLCRFLKAGQLHAKLVFQTSSRQRSEILLSLSAEGVLLWNNTQTKQRHSFGERTTILETDTSFSKDFSVRQCIKTLNIFIAWGKMMVSLVLDCSITSWMHLSFCYGWVLNTLCYMYVSLPMGFPMYGHHCDFIYFILFHIFICKDHIYIWLCLYMAVYALSHVLFQQLLLTC